MSMGEKDEAAEGGRPDSAANAGADAASTSGEGDGSGGAPDDGAGASNMPDPEADSGNEAARGYNAANSARTDAPANDTRK